jgi:hypothetical protein
VREALADGLDCMKAFEKLAANRTVGKILIKVA